MTHWTPQRIAALAAERGLSRLTPEHLERWLVLAKAAPDTTWLRDTVAAKDIEPAYSAAIRPITDKPEL
jgi:hypothetical protein